MDTDAFGHQRIRPDVKRLASNVQTLKNRLVSN